MADHNKNNRGLQELGGSDFEIADGQPNIRGWALKDEAGRKVGKVKELLFDPSTLKVRYIIANLKDNDLDLDPRKVLIPIGIARLHEEDDEVILPGVTVSQLQSLPEYDEDTFTTDSEQSVRSVFAGVGGAGIAAAASTVGSGDNDSDSFYNHDHFNEDNLYNSRTPHADRNELTDTTDRTNTADRTDTTDRTDRGDTSGNTEPIPIIQEELQVGKKEVVTGGVRLKSRIVETPVREELRLREETVRVERTRVDRPASEADLREESVELSERAEVPVVSKEAHVVEEVSLSKEVNERTETISDTVRNTEVDVENTGGTVDTSTRKTDDKL